jgi:hypothetical protein
MIHDQADETAVGEFVLARWAVGYELKLFFVSEWEGKPAPGMMNMPAIHNAYKWRSYHAARKYQRSHPCLQGHEIMDLNRIRESVKVANEAHELANFEPR